MGFVRVHKRLVTVICRPSSSRFEAKRRYTSVQPTTRHLVFYPSFPKQSITESISNYPKHKKKDKASTSRGGRRSVREMILEQKSACHTTAKEQVGRAVERTCQRHARTKREKSERRREETERKQRENREKTEKDFVRPWRACLSACLVLLTTT